MTQKNDQISSKKILLLFEEQSNFIGKQLEEVKRILDFLLFQPQKKEILPIQKNEILLVKVSPDAVLLRSSAIISKGFPLLYFVQQFKWLGCNELNQFERIQEMCQMNNNTQLVERNLNSFFRGCLVLDDNEDPLFILERLVREYSKNNQHQKEGDLNESISYFSKFLDKSLWAAKRGVSYSLDYISYLRGDEQLDTTNNSNLDRAIDFQVLRTNWYGRSQPRIFRFHSEYFERIDPKGSNNGTEEIKARFLYSNIKKITLENGTEMVIHFNELSVEAQYINSSEVDAMTALICTRAPFTSSIKVLRNLEMKMKRIETRTLEIQTLSLKEISSIRWSKDGMSSCDRTEGSYKARVNNPPVAGSK
eukprot:TRINITY_DN8187_c0_g1_i2.p1 TRINITY_DN8187_c0_g1~~TRINITY_DN8187_c0_g1_i2.p1  ORF type:complete len:364 (+),score=64.16 TRINITY_DN8187_c0_g1_i2:194-1285(+)